MQGGDVAQLTFGKLEWTAVRLAVFERLKPGGSVWYSDETTGGLWRQLDMNHGVLMDED